MYFIVHAAFVRIKLTMMMMMIVGLYSVRLPQRSSSYVLSHMGHSCKPVNNAVLGRYCYSTVD